MRLRMEPMSGEDCWTWATVDGAGAVVDEPLVCPCAVEAADASPAAPSAFVAMAEGALGPPDGLEMVA